MDNFSDYLLTPSILTAVMPAGNASTLIKTASDFFKLSEEMYRKLFAFFNSFRSSSYVPVNCANFFSLRTFMKSSKQRSVKSEACFNVNFSSLSGNSYRLWLQFVLA